MDTIKLLIDQLRERNEKHGCTSLDIIEFCNKAESCLPEEEVVPSEPTEELEEESFDKEPE